MFESCRAHFDPAWVRSAQAGSGRVRFPHSQAGFGRAEGLILLRGAGSRESRFSGLWVTILSHAGSVSHNCRTA